MRINAKPISEYPWIIRAFFRKQKHTYGAVLDPGLLWGRAPWIFATVALLYGAFNRRKSPIEPALRALITVSVSQINHCAFCIDINSATLLKRGVTQEKVEALSDWRNSVMFDDKEKAALDYAEAMTDTNRRVDDTVFATLKQHFPDDALVELTGLIAFQNMSSKFNSALDVPPQGFCKLPNAG